MARDKHETTIAGHRYEMTMMAATPGYKLFYRLMQMLGPSIATLKDVVVDGAKDAAGTTPSILDQQINADVVLKGVQVLTTNVSEADLDYVVRALKTHCEVGLNGSTKTIPLEGVFDVHFAGEMGAFFQWLAWGLKVQFQSFLSAFGNLKLPDAGGVFRAERHQSR